MIKEEKNDFAAQAEQQTQGLISEFIAFLKHNKKWWLTPIIVCLLLLAGLLLASPAVTPFIYTLF